MNDAARRLHLAHTRGPSGRYRIAVRGDLDVSTASVFRQDMLALLADGQSGPLDLVLSGVEFCDLDGLRALLSVRDAATRSRYQVSVTASSACLDLLLGVCQIGPVLGYQPPRTPGRG